MQATPRQRFYYTALFTAAAAIPFPFVFGSLAIIMLALAWVFNFNLGNFRRSISGNKIIALWIVFYLMHAATYFYSADKAVALRDLQTKMSFFVLPLLIGTGLPIDSDKLEKTFFGYIAGLSGMALYFLIHAVLRWDETGDTSVFFYHSLIYGVGANAVYYALYSFLALAVLLFYPFSSTWLVRRPVYFGVLATLLLFFVLLSSKSMLLLFFAVTLPLFYWRNIRKKGRAQFVYLALGLILAAGVFLTKNPIRSRFRDVIENSAQSEWMPGQTGAQQQHFNNLTLRLLLWQTAWGNIKEHNLWWRGCGTGSVAALQKVKFTEYNARYGYKELDPPLWSYNTHNMYLQELMMLGMPGLLVLLLVLCYPLAAMRRQPDVVRFLFHLSFVIILFSESSLQTQAGVVFFIFFSFVYYNYYYTVGLKIAAPEVYYTPPRRLYPYLAIAAVALIAYWQVALMSQIMLWDNLNISFPFRYYASECMRMHKLPLWLPYQRGGFPLFANAQAGCWHPFLWIFSCFSAYSLYNQNLEFAFSLIVAAFGMFRLSREWNGDRAGAIFAALSYLGCSLFVAQAQNRLWIGAAAWIPWVIWAQLRLARSALFLYVPLIAVFVYMAASGGSPEFLVVWCYIFVIGAVVALWRSNHATRMRLFLMHFFALVITLAVCANVIYALSANIALAGTHHLQNGTPAIPNYNLFTFFNPVPNIVLFNNTTGIFSLSNAYMGTIALIFCVLSFFQPKTWKWKVLFFSALFCFICGSGNFFSTGNLLPFVYYSDDSLTPAFCIFMAIALVLLASNAFTTAISDAPKWKNKLTLVSLSVLLIYSLILFFAKQYFHTSITNWINFYFDQHSDQVASFYIHLFAQTIVYGAFVAVFIFIMRRSVSRAKTIYLIYALVIADVFVSAQSNMYSSIVFRDFVSGLQDKIDRSPKGFPLPDNRKPNSWYYDSRYWWELPPMACNNLTIKKFPGTDGVSGVAQPFYDSLLHSAIKDSVWANPIAFFAAHLRVSTDSLMHKTDVLVTPRDAATLQRIIGTPSDADSIHFAKFGPNKIEMATCCNSQRLLVLQQNSDENWLVFVDGKKSQWMTVDITYLGVAVPAGSHRVQFQYCPPHIRAVLLLSIASLFACLTIILVIGLKNLSKKKRWVN